MCLARRRDVAAHWRHAFPRSGDRGADRGDRSVRRRADAARSAAARSPSLTEELRDAAGSDDHTGRHRRARGTAGVRRGARAGLHLGRPSPSSSPSCRRRRPRRRSCSIWSSARRASTPARGSKVPARSTPRTRRCAGSPTSPDCPETAGGVFVSGGTAGNLSALIAARWRWRHRADGAHDRTTRADDRLSRRPLVDRPGGAGDGRRRRDGAGRRPRSHGRRRAAFGGRRTRRRRS